MIDTVVDEWFTIVIGAASLGISIVALAYTIANRVSPYSVCFQSLSRKLAGFRVEPDSSHKEPRAVRLVSTRIVLWNAGGKALVYEDHVKEAITLSFDEDDSVFGHRILKQSDNVACSIEEVDRRSVAVKFSHLDRNDGVVVELYHDSKWQFPKIDGVIIDHHKGFRNLGTMTPGTARWLRRAIMRQSYSAIMFLVFGVALDVCSSRSD